jgi:hypothetical protein
MGSSWAGNLSLLLLCAGLTAGPLWLLWNGPALVEGLGDRCRRLDPRSRRPRATSRPIEVIARDVRRLHRRFRNPPRGIAFAKYEGLRRAYDKVLAEGCVALGLTHLLEVLPPGEELDAERDRVEGLLLEAGLQIDLAA